MIYLDHHATTPIDPRAVQAMLPLMTELYANAGSVTHAAGREVAELVDRSWHALAACLGAEADELVMTSGATESNNYTFSAKPMALRASSAVIGNLNYGQLRPFGRLGPFMH